MLDFLRNWITTQGIDLDIANILARSIIVGAIIIISIIARLLANRFILNGITSIIQQTQTMWDDILLRKKVFNRLSLLAPALVVYVSIEIPLAGYDEALFVINNILLIYMMVIVVLTLNSLLNASLSIYDTYDISKEIPIKGFIQVIKLLIFFVAGIFIVSILVNKTPIYLFSSLAALAAILMFVFKDSILGLVAGIQLTANRMLAKGDWIEMPKYGADGEIIEIALTTVKVQNWDKTITTIPTYALISESFKNWRGMSESSGRRIKRSINIDMNTIQFCSDEMLSRFSKIQYIQAYLENNILDIQKHNQLEQVDLSSPVNGRRMTNIGTFRIYVEAYLKNNPMINQEMTFLVRQLAPNTSGLPIEIYVFSKDKTWANYENIQANIFDHIIAVIPEFDLRVFQNPSGRDFNAFILH